MDADCVDAEKAGLPQPRASLASRRRPSRSGRRRIAATRGGRGYFFLGETAFFRCATSRKRRLGCLPARRGRPAGAPGQRPSASSRELRSTRGHRPGRLGPAEGRRLACWWLVPCSPGGAVGRGAAAPVAAAARSRAAEQGISELKEPEQGIS